MAMLQHRPKPAGAWGDVLRFFEGNTSACDSRALPSLTPQELAVAKLLILAREDSEIAEILHIGIKTVDSHKGRATEKLDIDGSFQKPPLLATVYLRNVIAQNRLGRSEVHQPRLLATLMAFVTRDFTTQEAVPSAAYRIVEEVFPHIADEECSLRAHILCGYRTKSIEIPRPDGGIMSRLAVQRHIENTKAQLAIPRKHLHLVILRTFLARMLISAR